ncbi:uncharacterized protein [Diadema antillarum]|uniref:uncharacterized protein n=1 Tax=Diadema antillarum TaxID=105358 RepID=UPI003A838DD9
MASYVGLNVGGRIYETSEMTLTSQPESFFTLLLSGNPTSAIRDERGNYRIDRDGDIFRYILNYLRDNKLILPEGFNELALLEREADFYQLPSLKTDIQALRVVKRSDPISLNVSGTTYTTTREVLSHEPKSVFQQILDYQATPVNGQYLIPGDGELFNHILEYLRFGALVPYTSSNGWESLKNEARFLKLEVLLAHIAVRQMLASDETPIKGLAMFARRDDFVLYARYRSILRSLATKLTKNPFPERVIYRYNCRIPIFVMVISLDRSRAGEPVSTPATEADPSHISRYPANREDMVALLSVLVGMETHRKVFPSSYLGLFCIPSDIVSSLLKEIF